MTPNTLDSALADWLAVIKRAKSPGTYTTYKSTASIFAAVIHPRAGTPLSNLSEADYETFLSYLKAGSPVTEKHHATIIALFFEYLSAKGICKINMDAIRYIRRNETRKVPKRLRKMDFPAVAEIAERVINIRPGKDVLLARAKAFVLLLCRSGLRAFEAAGLKMSDLDKKKSRGTIIGKGDKEAYFMLDDEVREALRAYHALRKEESNYIFISHSKRDAKQLPHPIETDTARRDVLRICDLLLDREPDYKITPHQFRHYFVTQVWRETGDIKQAQSAARHDNIATTENYIHTDDTDMEMLASKLKKRRQIK